MIAELVRRRLAGAEFGTLVRQTWWYAVLSAGLVGVFAIQATGTSAFRANTGFPGFARLWAYTCTASPFGLLERLGTTGSWLGGLLFAGAAAAGVAATFKAPAGTLLRGVRWPFLAVLAVSLAASCFMCAGVRHLMIYGALPLVLAAIGLRELLGGHGRRVAPVALIGVLALANLLSVVDPLDPYSSVLEGEPRYSEVARDLANELGPGDRWISWPYFAASPLYRMHRFPEPIMPLDEAEFQEALRTRPRDRPCFVLTAPQIARDDPTLRRSPFHIVYPGGMTLVKLPPGDDRTSP